MTFVRRSIVGSVKDRISDTCPAIWNTASRPPAKARSTSSIRLTSPRTNRAAAGTFSRSPVARLSITATSCASASRRSTMCEPMKPAPPVTRIRMTFPLTRWLLTQTDPFHKSAKTSVGAFTQLKSRCTLQHLLLEQLPAREHSNSLLTCCHDVLAGVDRLKHGCDLTHLD